MIPESGLFKPVTVRVHITSYQATKDGYSGQGVPRQCAEVDGLFQRARAEQRKRQRSVRGVSGARPLLGRVVR